MRNITLSDIAQKTGYSVNTISHALRDLPDIAPKTKEHIRNVAKEMGYIVNFSAAALRNGRSHSVAIIIGDISNPHFAIMIKEMESVLRNNGYNAITINTDEDEELERKAITSAISKNVDGIILCPSSQTRSNIEYLKSLNIPYVLIGRRFEGISSNYVICDDLNGGFIAAEYLINLGHKNILFINAPKYISSSWDRLSGVKKAFELYTDKGCTLQVETISPTMSDDIMPELLEKHSDCSAIICFSDIIAMQVCYFLKQMGKNIPEDVSIIGFDNIASKCYFPLMITSVTSSKTKMSNKAVEVLFEELNEANPSPKQLVLPTKIVERDTTAICKK